MNKFSTGDKVVWIIDGSIWTVGKPRRNYLDIYQYSSIFEIDDCITNSTVAHPRELIPIEIWDSPLYKALNEN